MGELGGPRGIRGDKGRPGGIRGDQGVPPNAVPQLLGHLPRGGLQGPAMQAAPPGQGDADGGPHWGAPPVGIAPSPPLPGILELLEKPQPLGDLGLWGEPGGGGGQGDGGAPRWGPPHPEHGARRTR